MLHVLIPRRSPEIAALRQYVGRKAQWGDTIRKHIGSTSPEAARGRAATGRALPNAVRDLLDAQQRLDRDAGRLIQVEAALGVYAPLNLCGVVEHWFTGGGGALATRGQPRAPWAAASS